MTGGKEDGIGFGTDALWAGGGISHSGTGAGDPFWKSEEEMYKKRPGGDRRL